MCLMTLLRRRSERVNNVLDLKPFTGDTMLIKQAIEKLHVFDDIAEEEI